MGGTTAVPISNDIVVRRKMALQKMTSLSGMDRRSFLKSTLLATISPALARTMSPVDQHIGQSARPNHEELYKRLLEQPNKEACLFFNGICHSYVLVEAMPDSPPIVTRLSEMEVMRIPHPDTIVRQIIII